MKIIETYPNVSIDLANPIQFSSELLLIHQSMVEPSTLNTLRSDKAVDSLLGTVDKFYSGISRLLEVHYYGVRAVSFLEVDSIMVVVNHESNILRFFTLRITAMIVHHCLGPCNSLERILRKSSILSRFERNSVEIVPSEVPGLPLPDFIVLLNRDFLGLEQRLVSVPVSLKFQICVILVLDDWVLFLIWVLMVSVSA